MTQNRHQDTASHENAAAAYARDGCCSIAPVYEADKLARVNAAIDAVLRGEYETGVAPFHAHDPGHLTQPLVKIDNAQLADREILTFLTDPAFGAWAGRVTGAQRVQIWSTQLLIKRPSGQQPADGERRSFAVHRCTETSRIRPDAEPNRYTDHLDDPRHAPVIWETAS